METATLVAISISGLAIKLFQLFVICDLITKRATSNVRIAKRKIWEKEPIVWEILQEVMRGPLLSIKVLYSNSALLALALTSTTQYVLYKQLAPRY
jgi:hypothetical protein